MKCPYCSHPESKVIDSRPVPEGNTIRRRRECLECGKRFNTFEMIESVQIIVIKKNGSKEIFDKTKLLGGLLKACQKRPVKAEEIVADIESELHNTMKNEVTTKELGEMVMERLRGIDEVLRRLESINILETYSRRPAIGAFAPARLWRFVIFTEIKIHHAATSIGN